MDGMLVLFWLALQFTWVYASVQRKLPNLRGGKLLGMFAAVVPVAHLCALCITYGTRH